MLVGNRMTKEPLTTADVLLSEAQEKMRRGGFRRLRGGVHRIGGIDV